MNSNTLKNGLLVTLLLTVLFLIIYNFKMANENKDLQSVFKQEKTDLKNSLDEMIKDYSEVTVQKKSLSEKLELEVQKMKNLRDSITKLEKHNYSQIRIYRNKIANLERENKQLFLKIDSLSVANETLSQENIIAHEILDQKEMTNNELTEKNKKLEAKVAIASKIDISPVKITAMKERSSGMLKPTSRSSRTDAFKINFDLLENPVTNSGKKKVYIQIVDAKKNVITPKGKTNLKNGTKILYSDSIIVNYDNRKVNLVSFVLVNRHNINKGKYIASAFVDGEYSGNAVINLK